MLSQALNSDTLFNDTFFNELKEVAEGPLYPQVTTVAYPTEPPQTKHPLPVEDEEDASMQPPSKRVRTSSDQFIRIPCKARAMSKKHNFDTAFLDVPIDAPHGLLLSCSHPECAESGKKFRYCTVCESPVAKRNFPKRHGHGLVESAKDLKAVDFTSSFVDINYVADASCYPCIEQTVAAPTFEKPIHQRVVSFDDASYVAQTSARVVQKAVATSSRTADPLLHLSAKEQQWLDLLRKRPNLEQEANMAGWMDKIISFSEEKRSALRKASVAPLVVEQPPLFAPVSPPQQRNTIATAPLLLQPVTIIDDEPTSSNPAAYDSCRSISPFVANMNIFDDPPVEQAVDEFLQSLEHHMSLYRTY
jgi:hypothetical protein